MRKVLHFPSPENTFLIMEKWHHCAKEFYHRQKSICTRKLFQCGKWFLFILLWLSMYVLSTKYLCNLKMFLLQYNFTSQTRSSGGIHTLMWFLYLSSQNVETSSGKVFVLAERVSSASNFTPFWTTKQIWISIVAYCIKKHLQWKEATHLFYLPILFTLPLHL